MADPERSNRDLRLNLLSPVTPSGDYALASGITSLSVHHPMDLGWVSEMNFIRADSPSQLRQRFIQIQVTDRRFKEPSWMHPNIGGEAQFVQGHKDEIDAMREELEVNATKDKLGEWTSTSISGNAILSSVLFSAGQTIAKAGKLAPVTQLFVITVVYCLRWVFEEVMSAVPLNGGFYTAMLNSAPKKVAAICAVFSMLSYLSTAVVNGVSAMNYVNESLVEIPVMGCTILLLVVFALLCLMGIAESAFVALILFVFHTFTLTLLGIFSLVYVAQHPSIFVDNMGTSLPHVTMFGGAAEASNIVSALFLGYGTAMLGVTGFESSSQYVEEQAAGINGLFQRLAIDRVLPSFLLKVNSCRGTNHYIILVFCIVCSSLVFILNAEVTVLSGVFALAFLSVLLSFTIAGDPTQTTTSWTNTCFCLVMISLGILSNAFSDVKALSYFFIYFLAFFVVVFLMLTRVSLLKGLLYISRKLLLHFGSKQGDFTPLQQLSAGGQTFVGSVKVAKTIETVKNTPVVFFCKAANLPKINEAVRCRQLFDHIYPSMKIDFVAVTGAFDPAMVQWLSKSMDVPTNLMFMRQPANENIHRVSALGVRVITD
ncbi:hypothetical protein PInf_006377 [Phytophthora infestans]|nr:hypothetical protein PInf_006377 [Phytophthora infestans]